MSNEKQTVTKIDADCTLDEVRDMLTDGTVHRGEAVDWLRAQDDVTIMEVVDLVKDGLIEEADAELIAKDLTARAAANLSKKSDKKPKQAPMSAVRFLAKAHPISAADFFKGKTLIPVAFKSGSYGYRLDGEANMTIRVDETEVDVMVNCNVTVPHSKPEAAKRAEKAARAAARAAS